MAINKAFVVKNGFEVSTDLIVADAITRKIGLGVTIPQYNLHVNGGIGATDLYVSGIGTFVDAEIQDLNVTDTLIVAGLSTFNSNVFVNSGLNITGVTTLGGYVDINNSVDIFGNLNISGIATIATVSIVGLALSSLIVTGISTLDITRTTQLNVSGIGTITNLNSTSGTITNLTGTAGTITNFNSTDANLTNISGTNLNYSGISTLGNVNISSGIITATSGIVTYFGDGSGLTGIANTANIVSTAITTGTLNVGTGITANASGIDVTGIITATSFVGNGSGLTGAGSTVSDDTTTNDTFYPIFTQTTSGIITTSKVSTTKLNFNPSTGVLTVVDLNSTSDINLKENIKTIENATQTIESLRGVSFDWKETGRSSYGVIAQELEEVLPELVGDGTVKSVNYNGIIGVLIEAIKELKKEIEDLKNTK